MRKSSTKTRKASSTHNSFRSLQIELELLASRAKNAQLTQAFAKALCEKFEMKRERLSLQRALVDAEIERNRLEIELEMLTESISKCTPLLLDMFNLFLQGTSKQISKSTCAVEHHSDKDYITNFKVKPPPADLNPTISLLQLALNNAQSKTSIDYKNSLPLPSNSSNENCENVGSSYSYDTGSECLLTKKTITCTPLAPSFDAALQLDEDGDIAKELPNVFESERHPSINLEESIGLANGQMRTSLGETQIYVSKHLTCLSMETTVAEDDETGLRARLKDDTKLISPHFNSMRLDADKLMFVDVSKGNSSRREEPESVMPSVSVISPENDLSEPERHVASNPLVELTTPSLLSLSEPKILTESGQKSSPMPYCASSLRSKTRRKPVSEAKEDESPRSSRQNHMNRKPLSVINRHQPESGEINLTPIVVLERVEYVSTKQDCVRRVNHLRDVPKENETIPNIVEDSGIQNKPRKEKVKCKKTDKSNLCQDKISDVQTGRSDSSSNRPEPATNSNTRPHRAAKPKILKELSLKMKLRRMV